MRVLVTGVNGFIGRHLLDRAPADWTILTNRGNLAVECVAPQADVVINLASRVDVPKALEEPRQTMANNVGIAHSLVDYATKHDPLIVHVSTAEAFGPGGPYGLESPPRPTNPYAASKVAQDAVFRAAAACYGIRVVTARTANVFGDHQPVSKFVPTVIRNLIAGVPVKLFGHAKRRWIYADDVADALIALAYQPVDANLTGSTLVDNAEIVYSLAARLHVTPNLEVTEDARPGHEDVYDVEPVNMPIRDDINRGLDHMVTAWS